jgi:hypothetical protein
MYPRRGKATMSEDAKWSTEFVMSALRALDQLYPGRGGGPDDYTRLFELLGRAEEEFKGWSGDPYENRERSDP